MSHSLTVPVARRQVLRSQRVVTPAGTVAASIVVLDGRIERIESYTQPCPGLSVKDDHDFGHLAILPGLVDTHVHINEPGRADWEGFHTATRAAAAGGYTTLVDMPLNSLPATTSVTALGAKRAAATGQCRVDWAAWGGVISHNTADIVPLAAAGVRGYKCFLVHPGPHDPASEAPGEFTLVDEAQLRIALPLVARSGLPLLVHAELPGPIEAIAPSLANADWQAYSTWLASRPDQAELDAIALLIRLCREFRTPIHVVHLSSALAVPMLRAARTEGLPITVETCPHYLHFSAEAIPGGATLLKCAPPIRTAANQSLLWQALIDGDIDLIATDHSPCPPHLKHTAAGDFEHAWGGISSLSVALPVIWTGLRSRGLTLNHLATWMSAHPARLAGLDTRKGRIEAGWDADLVVFDPDFEFTVTADLLHTRHTISPYLGEALFGRVNSTWLRGRCIYTSNTFPGDPAGIELQP